MGQYVGLDVSLEETTVHVLDEQGKRVWHGTCVSHPAAIAATIRKHAPDAVRIGLETGQLTTWLWQALTKAGLPMVCLDSRQAKAALNMRINKTDDNDAEDDPIQHHRLHHSAMADYLKKLFSHNPLVARKPLIRVT
jgi:transposase